MTDWRRGEVAHRVCRKIELRDGSASLLVRARARLPHAARPARAPPGRGAGFDAITCRGALNDLLDDRDRDAAVTALARHLNDTSMLLLDVRDADLHQAALCRGLTSQRAAKLPDGRLLFRATGTCEDGLLHLHERREYRHQEAGRACDPS